MDRNDFGARKTQQPADHLIVLRAVIEADINALHELFGVVLFSDHLDVRVIVHVSQGEWPIDEGGLRVGNGTLERHEEHNAKKK